MPSLYAVGMTLQEEVRSVVRDAEFVKFWPATVKDVLIKALRTEGDIPAFAEFEVKNALRDAQRIERKFIKDIEQGEKSLSQADRRRLAVSK